MKSSVRALGFSLAVAGIFGLIHYIGSSYDNKLLLLASASIAVFGGLVFFSAKSIRNDRA